MECLKNLLQHCMKIQMKKNPLNNAFHIPPKEASCDDDVHMHEDIPAAIIMDLEKDKGLISLVNFL